MNDAGIVAGGSAPCESPNNLPPPFGHAVLWKDGVPHALGSLGGTAAVAGAINEQGQVVGVSTLPGDAVVHAFIWQERVGMKDLGSLLPDDNFVFPQSINNRGEVVGLSCGPSEPIVGCAGFYWRNGVMIDLNAHLAQPFSLPIGSANDINDSGEIAVWYFDPNFNGGARGGDQVPAVLVPEPGAVTSQSSQSQSPAAVQPSVSWRVVAQRFGLLGPRGWRLAR